MSNSGQDSSDGVVTNGKKGSGSGWFGRWVENSNLTPREIDSIFNCILAIVVLCVVMSLCFMTLSLDRHVISLVLFPIIAFVLFSSPGFNLRMREYKSMLILTDLMAIMDIIGLSIYMDHLYATHASSLIYKIFMCLVGEMALTAYLCRAKVMFYLTLPFFTVYTVLMFYGLGFTEYEALALGGFLVMVFAWALYGNAFYFGIGRVCIDGSYIHMPESEARYVRLEQRRAEQARKENVAAELERRKKLQRQGPK